MLETVEPTDLSANKLLATFSNKQLRRLTERGELVELTFGAILHEKGESIRDVYFPTSGVVSVFAVEDQTTLEVGMVGNEGAVGISIFAGVAASPYLTVVQSAGAAFKVPIKNFFEEFEQNKLFTSSLNRYTHFLQAQISQTVFCFGLHLIEARLACLLLLMQDRLRTNQFRLKQEFLARMLGVRREAVTRAARSLQQQKIISYSRGNLLILDRSGLTKVCCRCYEIVTEEYHNLLAVNK